MQKDVMKISFVSCFEGWTHVIGLSGGGGVGEENFIQYFFTRT